MSESFYVPDGETYVPSVLTRGPWDPNAQHGGPPTALLGTVLEQRHPRDDARVVRFTVEIFRPVPIAPLTIATRVARPGKKVELLEATMEAGGQRVLQATVWRVRIDETTPAVAPRVPPLPPPEAGRVQPFFPTGQTVGYHTAMEVRFLTGGFTEVGPATAWMRMRHPVLPDAAPTPLARVLIAADSGNGVSGELDYRSWLFVNPDLTVYLHRMPAGEWIGLDASTAIAGGVGLAQSTLHDVDGAIGRGLQALFVGARA